MKHVKLGLFAALYVGEVKMYLSAQSGSIINVGISNLFFC